jgi:hypothetical protein
MLLDFTRHYTSMQAFMELNGNHCVNCKGSYAAVVSSPNVYQQIVQCAKCKWKLTFTSENGCHKPSIFYYKQYAFAIDNVNNLHIQEGTMYQWGVWKKDTTMISFQTILEAIRTGECALECLLIKKRLEAKKAAAARIIHQAAEAA